MPLSESEQARLKRIEQDVHDHREAVEKDLMGWRTQNSEVQRATDNVTARRFADLKELIKEHQEATAEWRQKQSEKIDKLLAIIPIVEEHDRLLLGEKRCGGALVADASSLKDSRKYVTILVGLAVTWGGAWLWFNGDTLKERGILNLTKYEIAQIVDGRIRRWFPAATPPPPRTTTTNDPNSSTSNSP